MDDASSSDCPGGSEQPLVGNYFVAAYPPFSCWSQEAVSDLEQRLAQPTSGPSGGNARCGLYVHIPFCSDRCGYCYYRSFDSFSRRALTEYVNALFWELGRYAKAARLQGRACDFVYVGGGTPSLLPAADMERLMVGLRESFPWSDGREVTFECAPKTVNLAKIQALRRAGVTRLSLGIQQLDDHVLRLNGRVHLTQDVLRAYDVIQQIGFATVNVDLMVGLLGETDESFTASLERVIALRPDSISIYQLELPRNTPLTRQLLAGTLPADLAGWTVKRRRLGEAFARLEQDGYTIATAYAAVRDPQRHPFVYQHAQYHGADVLGVGCSAFSYLDGIHFQNVSSLAKYHGGIAAEQLPWARAYVLNAKERMTREFVLQLKLGGADPRYFADRFGIDLLAHFASPLATEQKAGRLVVGPDRIELTRQGLLDVDHWLCHFYPACHREATSW